MSGFTIDEIEPRLFSFNNPYGACPTCDGLGAQMYFDPELVVPNESLSLREGAIAPWANSPSQYYDQTLDSLARQFKFTTTVPFRDLPERAKQVLLHGSGDEPAVMRYNDGLRSYETRKPFEGVIPNLERRWRETESAWIREELGRFQTARPCEACRGQRLKLEALSVKIGGLNVSELTEMSVDQAERWFRDLEPQLGQKQREIAERVLKEIR